MHCPEPHKYKRVQNTLVQSIVLQRNRGDHKGRQNSWGTRKAKLSAPLMTDQLTAITGVTPAKVRPSLFWQGTTLGGAAHTARAFISIELTLFWLMLPACKIFHSIRISFIAVLSQKAPFYSRKYNFIVWLLTVEQKLLISYHSSIWPMKGNI